MLGLGLGELKILIRGFSLRWLCPEWILFYYSPLFPEI